MTSVQLNSLGQLVLCLTLVSESRELLAHEGQLVLTRRLLLLGREDTLPFAFRLSQSWRHFPYPGELSARLCCFWNAE